MDKVKVLFISHSSDLAGAERSLFELLRGLNKDKYEALVLFPKDGPLRMMVKNLGWTTMVLDMPWWIACGQRNRWHVQKVIGGMPKRVRNLRRLIRDRRIDIVYTNTIVSIDGAIAAKLQGIPHIWHVREILSKDPGLKAYLPITVMNLLVDLLSDMVIVPSNFAKKELQWKYANHNKIRVVYNCIDVTRYDSKISADKNQKVRDELSLPREAKIVTLTGGFMERKGQVEFVEAAKIVSNHFKNAVFLLIGGGSERYKSLVKTRVAQLGIEDRVYFLEFRKDIEQVMDSVDILVCASLVESFSRSVLDSMTAGKPVVSTRCGGPEEIVVDGETGLLVPIKDPTRLANAIIQLIADENAAKEMGRRGRQRVEEFFNTEQYVKNIENVIAGLC